MVIDLSCLYSQVAAFNPICLLFFRSFCENEWKWNDSLRKQRSIILIINWQIKIIISWGPTCACLWAAGTYPPRMTPDFVSCPEDPDSSICLVDVADSLSAQQVLSGLTFGQRPAPMDVQAVCWRSQARLVGTCRKPPPPTSTPASALTHRAQAAHSPALQYSYWCTHVSAERRGDYSLIYTYVHSCRFNMSQLVQSGCANTMTPAIWPVTYCSSLGLKATAPPGR